MDIYLSLHNDVGRIRLPVLPEQFEMTCPSSNTTLNINQLGDVNLIGKTGLCEISIESMFPAQEYPFVTHKPLLPPYDYVKMIQGWQRGGNVLRLIITGTPVNMTVAIENFSYSETDATRDVRYALELKEYRFVNVKTVKTVTTPTGTKLEIPPTQREAPLVPTEYTIIKGDTLWAIAKKLTGNGANYKQIAQANGIKDPDKIYPGQHLVI